jgi:hypothetical protein
MPRDRSCRAPERRQRIGERVRPRREIGIGIERFDRRAICALACGARLGEAFARRGAEPRQCFPGGRQVLDVPENRRVRERLEPVRQRERGIRMFGLAKRVAGRAIREAVQQRDATNERGLRARRAGGRKVNDAQSGGGRRGRAQRAGVNVIVVLRGERRRQHDRQQDRERGGRDGLRSHGRSLSAFRAKIQPRGKSTSGAAQRPPYRQTHQLLSRAAARSGVVSRSIVT